MRTAVNQTKIKTLTFQQSVTRDWEGGQTVTAVATLAIHPHRHNLQLIIRQTAGNASHDEVSSGCGWRMEREL
jgi:mannitol/fructose-specific phosphotransferase system IIA component